MSPTSRRAAVARSHAVAPEPDVPAGELLVLTETPAPVYEPAVPAATPRIRATPPEHRRVPKSARLVTIDIADPDYVPCAAEMVEAPAGAVMNGHGAHHEWQPRTPRTVRVVARADVIALMHARGQIGDADFHAGRRFQQLYENAELVGLPTVDLSMPRIAVSAGSGNYVGLDARRRAAAKLHQVEAELVARFGLIGLQLVRDVLGRALTIEQCTANRGDGSDRQSLRFWGSLLRRCLRALVAQPQRGNLFAPAL